MTKFIIIDDETKHFIKADIIDHVQSVYFERHHNGKQIEPFQSVLNVGNKQIHSPLTVDEIWKRIHADEKSDSEIVPTTMVNEHASHREVGSAREKRLYGSNDSDYYEVRVQNHDDSAWHIWDFTSYTSAMKEYDAVKIDDETPDIPDLDDDSPGIGNTTFRFKSGESGKRTVCNHTGGSDVYNHDVTFRMDGYKCTYTKSFITYEEAKHAYCALPTIKSYAAAKKDYGD